MTITPLDIIDFWRAAGPRAWFAKNEDFDALLRGRFEAEHHAAARGERERWAMVADGALALILLFDQFPRNMWRSSAHAYATDPLARQTARRAIETGQDRLIDANLRAFVYLPFEHSEDPADQNLSVGLSEALQREGGPRALAAYRHREIIARFGRFPHRNRALGRETTPEETAFLEGGGFLG